MACTPKGADSVRDIFGDKMRHCPFSPSDFAFTVPATVQNEEEDNLRTLAAMRKFADYERALDALPRPTLVMCKSNKRAGCVESVYAAVKAGQTFDALVASNIMPWHGAPGMVHWAKTVVNAHERRRAQPFIFRQLFEKESSTFTYLLADPVTKECLLIDPVIETVDRDYKHVEEMGLSLKYVINTHVHADHVTGTGLLKQKGAAAVEEHNAKRRAVMNDGASTPEEEAKWADDKRRAPQSALAAVAGAVADIQLSTGSHLSLGTRRLLCINTPGHTAGCMTFVTDDCQRIFTGDTLLIRGCGRTDFQEGSSNTLYDSVHTQLFTLPNGTEVWPAHNYGGLSCSTIGEERSLNPRLACEGPMGPIEKNKFYEIMDNLKLPYPRKIDIALPANLQCGV